MEEVLLAKTQGPITTLPSKPGLSNALRKTFSPTCLKSKREEHIVLLTDSSQTPSFTRGSLYHFPVLGLGNLRHRRGEVLCQGALTVTLLLLIY